MDLSSLLDVAVIAALGAAGVFLIVLSRGSAKPGDFAGLCDGAGRAICKWDAGVGSHFGALCSLVRR